MNREESRRTEQSPSIAGSGIVRGQGGMIPTQVTAPRAELVNHIDSGGLVLTNVNVYLVYWGSTWAQNATPSAGDITNSVMNILSGAYMSALAQYRNIGRGRLYGATLVTTSNPPGTFSKDDVGNLLKDLLNAQAVPAPNEVNQLLYFVIMPVGVSSNQRGVIGEHFSIDQDIFCAWVMNNGTLNYVTTIFSHALVEACTNPRGDGFQLIAPGYCIANPFSWCEIGDVCDGMIGTVNGVAVQAYWSARDKACVVPGSSSRA